MTDQPHSIRTELRAELAPIQVTLEHIADEQGRQGCRLDKIETALHGNGRPGVTERLALVERACKSIPPAPRAEQPSYVDLEIARVKTSGERWVTAGRIVALVLAGIAAGGVGHWGVSQATAASQVAPPR